MALEDKRTRLNNMLSARSGATAEVGKRTGVDANDPDADQAGTDNAAGADHAASADHAAGADNAAGGDHAASAAPAASGELEVSPEPSTSPASASAGDRASTPPSSGGFAGPAAIAGTKEGGTGDAAPATPGKQAAAAPGAAAAPSGGAPAKGASAGKISVQSDKSAKGAAASPARFGVGEKVTFTAQEEGSWRVDQNEIGRGQSVDWTAPATGMLRNLVFEPDLTSPNKNTQASLPLLVLAPSNVAFKKVGDVPATGPGLAGVGMTLAVSISPDDVSFGNAEWLEKPGPAEGVSGYFAAYVATGQSLAHPPNPNWLPMGDDNKAIVDNAWTRDKPKLKHPTDGTQRWWAGSFQWTIPNVYRVKGVGGEHKIVNVVQRFTMDDTGAITVTKGGASATARPDNKMDGEIQKFANLQEAKTFLQPHGRSGCTQAVMNYKRNPKADPASVQHLLAALKSFDITLYVAVTCKNTFSWTDPDSVSVKANGQAAKGGERKINTGKSGEFTFQVNDIMDVANLGTTPISLFADARDLLTSHPHTATLAYPYNVSNAAMDGSDRYTYSAFFK